MRGTLILTLITVGCGGAASGGASPSAAGPVALVGARGHQIAETCRQGPNLFACTTYLVDFSVADSGDAAIERVDALDLHANGRSLLADGPIACDRVPWTVGAAQSAAVTVGIEMTPDGDVTVPCGPEPLTDVIHARIIGGLPLVGALSIVDVAVAGHLADGTTFNVSNSVDVTSTQ